MKMALREMGREGGMDQDRVYWRALVTMIMNLCDS